MISLFVHFFLTITQPLADSEQQPARLLGRQRFEAFVVQIGRRLASDRRLISDVLKSIAVHNKPELFATATNDAPVKPPPAETSAVVSVESNGKSPMLSAEKRHG